MAKRYYWLKLKEDFFDDKCVKALRKLPDGDALTIVYLKMQLKSLKTEGIIKYDKILPSAEEELALILDEDVNIVRLALTALINMGVVERWNDDSFYMAAMQNLIGSESESAQRMRKHRELKSQIESGGNNVTHMLPEESEASQCDGDVIACDTEIEIDIEKDKDIEKEKKKKKGGQAAVIAELVDDEDIISAMDEFIKMRKLIKKPMTDNAIRRMIKKLQRLTSDKETQIKVLEQSIDHNWLDIYPLKEEERQRERTGGSIRRTEGDDYAEFG